MLANSTGWDGTASSGPPKKRFIKNSTKRPLKDVDEETNNVGVDEKECDDDHDEGEEEIHEDVETEKQIVTQGHTSSIAIIGRKGIIPFNRNLDEMIQNLKNSIEGRGFRVSKDGIRIELSTDIIVDPNYEDLNQEVVISTSGPLSTKIYFDQVVSNQVNTNPVMSLVRKCADSFCEALSIQDNIVDLQQKILVLREKQKNIWQRCKDTIISEYPHPQLRAEDKELFFNIALLGKSFVPNLIQARALEQLIEFYDNGPSQEPTGYYGISKVDLLTMASLTDDENLNEIAKLVLEDLTLKLKKFTILLTIGYRELKRHC